MGSVEDNLTNCTQQTKCASAVKQFLALYGIRGFINLNDSQLLYLS